MKQIIYILTLGLFLLTQLSASAQRSERGKERWEKYKSEKVSFLTDKLELTPSEAQKFWPVYNQMEKERWEAQKSRREMEHELRESETSLSAEEITELTRKFAGSLKTEADIMINYNEKLLEILSPQKVLTLYKTENEFRMHMIKKYRNQRKNGDNHP
jgi:Spy/CpxP family protein refolding chaperone